MQTKRYGLVISDWNMEPMTGFDLLQKVRSDPRLGETPFIMVTAESKTENVIAAKKAGVNNYIVKPFNAQTLKAKIDAVFVDARRSRRRLRPPRIRTPRASPHQAARDGLRRDAGGGENSPSALRSGASRSPSSSAWMPAVTNRQSRPNAAAPLRSVRTESPIASTRALRRRSPARSAAALASAAS